MCPSTSLMGERPVVHRPCGAVGMHVRAKSAADGISRVNREYCNSMGCSAVWQRYAPLLPFWRRPEAAEARVSLSPMPNSQ